MLKYLKDAQNIENVTNQLNNNANNGQAFANSDYTVNTESLAGKPSSYFQNNNQSNTTYGDLNTGRGVGQLNGYSQIDNQYNNFSSGLYSGNAVDNAIGNTVGTVSTPDSSSYVAQSAYTPSPVYGASKTTGYQIQSPYNYSVTSKQNTFGTQPSAIMQAISNYAPNATAQYSVPQFSTQISQRKVHRSLTGFRKDNQRWHDLNPQKSSYTFVEDEYENNPLVI